MAIPLLAYGAGAFALNKIFNHRQGYDLPASPQFFGPEFQRYLTAVKQREQARYGGAVGDIRETLGNYGLLGSGALPEAITRTGIQEGQDIASAEAGAIGQEYAAQQGFRTGPEYSANLGKAGVDYTAGLNTRDTQLESINQILKVLGAGLAKPKADEKPRIVNGQPVDENGRPLDPSDPRYWEILNSKTSKVHDILKTLFGFSPVH